MEPTSTYRADIDGLRAIAVVAVILYHSEITLSGLSPFEGGYLGVDIFFVISGYLISSIVFRELKAGKFSFLRFYERRARRILPALLATIVATFIAGLTLVPWRLEALAESGMAAIASIANFYFWQQSGYFETASIENPLLHTWSLAVEEQFYLVFPILALLAWRLSPKAILPTLVIVTFGSLIAAQLTVHVDAPKAFFLLPYRAWELAIGGILAAIEISAGHRRSVGRFAWVFTGAGLLLIFGSFATFDSSTFHPSIVTLLPVMGVAMIIWFANDVDPLTRLLSLKPVVAIGRISYSLYLWHFPIFSFAAINGIGQDTIGKLLLICITIAVSIVSYYFIEQPFRNRRRISARAIGSVSVAGCFSVAAVGGALALSEGLPQRYSPADIRLVQMDRDALNDYVWSRKADLHLAPFEDDKPKVLVIGDSYSADIINALYEVGLDRDISISSYTLRTGCGNVYVDHDISENIAPKRQSSCAANDGYHDPALIDLMEQADAVLIASAWYDWEVNLLPESLRNIRAHTDAEVVVVGRKNFGAVEVERLLSVPHQDRPTLRNPVASRFVEQDRLLRSHVSADNYLPLFDLLCEGYTCPVFREDGELISYDGGHLTPAGAEWVGEHISPLLSGILEGGSRALHAAGG